MGYTKVVTDNFILGIGLNQAESGITKEEFDAIEKAIKEQPTAPDGYQYRLRADTLTWELVEAPVIEPTEEEEATESDYITALQDLGVDV